MFDALHPASDRPVGSPPGRRVGSRASQALCVSEKELRLAHAGNRHRTRVGPGALGVPEHEVRPHGGPIMILFSTLRNHVSVSVSLPAPDRRRLSRRDA